MFSEEEACFVGDGFIGRVATVSQSGQPHVVPVAYRFDGESFVFGGAHLSRSLKFRNLVANPLVAMVVDDFSSGDRWVARGVEVRGVASAEHGSSGETVVKITRMELRSWGLEER